WSRKCRALKGCWKVSPVFWRPVSLEFCLPKIDGHRLKGTRFRVRVNYELAQKPILASKALWRAFGGDSRTPGRKDRGFDCQRDFAGRGHVRGSPRIWEHH